MKRILGALLIVALAGLVTLPADAASKPKRVVRGTVTAKADGTTISGIQVCAQRPNGAEACTTSGDDGRYSLRLKGGAYTVAAQDPYLYGSWVRNELNHGKALNIAKSRTLNIAMVRGARITGYLRTPDGQDVSSCCLSVEAYAVGSHGRLGPSESWFSNVGPSGYFEVAKLPAGRYKLLMTDNSEPITYASQWYPDAAAASAGTAVSVTTGQQASGHDINLRPASTLIVRLREQGKKTSGWLDVFDSDKRLVASVQSRSGTATVRGLHAGRYRVRGDFRPSGYMEWFKRHTTFKAATRIAVAAERTTTVTFDVTVPRLKTIRRPSLKHAGDKLLTGGGRWNARPSTLTYRWYRDGKALRNEVFRDIWLDSDDIGHRLKVCVRARRGGYYDGRSCSASTHRLTASDVD